MSLILGGPRLTLWKPLNFRFLLKNIRQSLTTVTTIAIQWCTQKLWVLLGHFVSVYAVCNHQAENRRKCLTLVDNTIHIRNGESWRAVSLVACRIVCWTQLVMGRDYKLQETTYKGTMEQHTFWMVLFNHYTPIIIILIIMQTIERLQFSYHERQHELFILLPGSGSMYFYTEREEILVIQFLCKVSLISHCDIVL